MLQNNKHDFDDDFLLHTLFIPAEDKIDISRAREVALVGGACLMSGPAKISFNTFQDGSDSK